MKTSKNFSENRKERQKPLFFLCYTAFAIYTFSSRISLTIENSSMLKMTHHVSSQQSSWSKVFLQPFQVLCRSDRCNWWPDQHPIHLFHKRMYKRLQLLRTEHKVYIILQTLFLQWCLFLSCRFQWFHLWSSEHNQ